MIKNMHLKPFQKCILTKRILPAEHPATSRQNTAIHSILKYGSGKKHRFFEGSFGLWRENRVGMLQL